METQRSNQFDSKQHSIVVTKCMRCKGMRVAVGDSWDGLEARAVQEPSSRLKATVAQGVAVFAGAMFVAFMVYAMAVGDQEKISQGWSMVQYAGTGIIGWALGERNAERRRGRGDREEEESPDDG